MRSLYFHIAELMDKSMHQLTHAMRYGDDTHHLYQVLALEKEVHAQAEILLHMSRYYKDQIPGCLDEETLSGLVNRSTEHMRVIQDKLYDEYLEQLPIKDQNNKKEEE